MKNRGYMQIPFSMLFSIILIIAFIAVAIYAIVFFLNFNKCAETGIFKNDLQDKISKAWQSDESFEVFNSSLPSDIDFMCFIDSSQGKKGDYKDFYDEFRMYGFKPETNMFFYPLKKSCEELTVFEIEHLNMTKITETNNPYCIKNNQGRIEIEIEKNFNDYLVGVR